MKFTQAFERYWKMTNHHLGNLELWQSNRVKEIAFRAYQKGRQHEQNK